MNPMHNENVMRSSVLRVAAAVIGVVIASVVVIAPAHAGHPVRSGTILIAARPTNGLGPMPGCGGEPDCLVWLQTCTRPASTKLGVTSSIVDVRDLARSSKRRTFEVVDRAAPVIRHGVTVEFWDESCRPVYLSDGRRLSSVSWSRFKVPRSAVWMTVTSSCPWLCMSFSGVALRWELR